MVIHRLEVEEGFLDGLDITFSPSLNVLIGPRGCGKTSIIELVRFCLAAQAATERSAKMAREHALSILGSGRVTVTLQRNGQSIKVTRSAEDPRPRASGTYTKPLVFSQNEIESVGLEGQGRLRILDGFISEPLVQEAAENATLGPEVRSLTSEISDLLRELEEEALRAAEFRGARAGLKEALAEQEELLRTVTEAEEDRKNLASLGDRVGATSARHEAVERTLASLREWHQRIEECLRRGPTIPMHDEPSGDDHLARFRSRLEGILESLQAEAQDVARLIAEITAVRDELSSQRIELEDHARDLRRQLEALQEGAGAAALRVSELQERVALQDASNTRTKELQDQLKRAQKQRGLLLDQLEEGRVARFEARKVAAERVNDELGPTIEVQVERGGLDEAYANAVREGLRGSGLHYNIWAPQVAERMSPRELTEAVEGFEIDLLAQVLETSKGRAERIASELRDYDLGHILSIPVQDTVTLLLLDGPDYKPTPELSTGQRCTVVLSTLLAQHGPTLIVDQPEDHLDNAFVVDTLVESILKAKSDRQMILATHNPNIPVLGDADLVIHLGSDGRRGFVRTSGHLEEAPIVRAISTVMEGGAAAFARRADFYHRFLEIAGE